ncbi:MAG: response regulator [Phycisphaerales bacterium]
MTTDTIIHVVDDDDAMRASTVQLLTSRGYGAVGYASAEDFLERAVWTRPGCVLVDLRMPGMGGEGLVSELAKDGDPPPTIVLTGHGTIENAVRTVREGALDFLEKPCPNDRLLEAVDKAVEVDRLRLERLHEVEQLRQRVSTLTPREKGILDEMLTGKTSPEIASVLGLQPKSVQVYRSRVLQKMGFATTVEMVRHLLIADPGTWSKSA